MTTATGQIIVARDAAAYFRRAVDLFIVGMRQTGRPVVALSGGSTPKKLFELLAGPDARPQVPWDRIEFFWGDERCVPPEHADSNYRMAWDALLSKVPVPSEHIHRMKGEMEPEAAARAYEAEMARVMPDRPFPRFDFNLLGMGEDGHTASLFPGSPGLDERERWVVGHRVEKLKTNRITITFPVINSARRTVVMVAGESKADILAGVFAGTGRYPIERVNPAGGELIWLLDAAAAQKLPDAARGSATYI